MTPVRLTVVPDEREAARVVAERMARAIGDALARRDRAHVALAGGGTPRLAYRLLGALVDEWERVELWFGDERAVGPGDPASNHHMAAQVLPAGRMHRIRGEDGPDAAAAAYAAELSALVPAGPGGIPVLDLAVLGLGEDGHTASLFPGDPALAAGGLTAAVHAAPKPPPGRITLTLPVLRAARARIVLATGSAKARPVAAVMAGPDPEVPASLLGTVPTDLVADAAAAAEMPE